MTVTKVWPCNVLHPPHFRRFAGAGSMIDANQLIGFRTLMLLTFGLCSLIRA
jgi:hypothetical protein